MQPRMSKEKKALKISFEGLRKVRPVARLGRDPKILLLNAVATELVKPAFAQYYDVAIDPGGVYKGRLFLIPSETPTLSAVRFHGGDKETRPNRLYIANLIYNVPGFNMGETCTYVVSVQVLDPENDPRKIIVLTELKYQQS
ncbi:MAG: hypothetical protein [Cryophage ML09]|nr:MAG: hypothetical protein [Cryophage ML09]